jgi:hypothetical protein
MSIANQDIVALYSSRLSKTISRLVGSESDDQFHVMYGNMLQYVPTIASKLSSSEFFTGERK